jgi:Mrp family chromosome partitioning ATPase
LRSKINELNRIYLDGGGKDKELEELINGLRVQLQYELGKQDFAALTPEKRPKSQVELMREKEDLELQVTIINSNIGTLRSRVASLKGNVSTIGNEEAIISSLERERENAFIDYMAYVEKLNDAKSKSLISNSGLNLMIMGQPSPEPEPSKRLVYILISMIGSFFMCVGLIVSSEFFDTRIKTPNRFERMVRLKLLGYVNFLPSQKNEFGFLNNDKDRKDVEHLVNLLRKIRFSIELLKVQVILISAPNKGDGKSFFIKALAQSFSLMNKRTLIIDTNFRNNSLSQLIIGNKMLEEPLLLKLLNDNTTDTEKSHDDGHTESIIHPTSDRNVDIIGSRKGYESPSELFSGKNFVSLISSFRDKYDYILLEGPALNEYSDSKELSEYVDGIIAVFSAENSILEKDRDTVKYLKSVNGKFLGAVLNFVRENELS